MLHKPFKRISVIAFTVTGMFTCFQALASQRVESEFFTSGSSASSFSLPLVSDLFRGPLETNFSASSKVVFRLEQKNFRTSSDLQIESALQKHGMSAFVKLQRDQSTSIGSEIERYKLSYLGKPYCHGFVRKIPGIWNQPIVVSDFPVVKSFEEPESGSSQIEDIVLDRWSSEANVDDQLDLLQFSKQYRTNSDSCWLVRDGRARLVSRLRFPNFVVIASTFGIEDVEPTGFDVKSLAVVPVRHAFSNQWSTIDIDTDGSGYLQNEVFVSDPIGQRYSSAQGVFNWPEDLSAKEELFSFTSANLQRDFIESFKGIWTKSEPIVIKTGLPNIVGRITASYYWADRGLPPTISIARGQSGSFENLGLDGDVVSHEYNHHVIYQSIKGTEGQSRAIHEGLADFFVAARTKDSCIGTIVCGASNDSTCGLFRQQCLRSLSQDFDFQDVRNFEGDAVYNQSMVLSGFLWDLITKHSVPQDLLVNMVLRATTLVPEKPSFLDFMNALRFVDQEMGGAFNAAIDSAALLRTLDKKSLNSLTSQAYLSDDRGYHSDSKRKSEIERAFGCSTIGRTTIDSQREPVDQIIQAFLLAVFLVGLPLGCILTKRLKS
jgi:hypothetical protein